VLTKVYGDVIDLIALPDPCAMSARWSAAVQEERATPWSSVPGALEADTESLEPTYFVYSGPSSRAFGPK